MLIKNQNLIIHTCCNKVDLDGVDISSKNKNSSSINSSIFSSLFNKDKEEWDERLLFWFWFCWFLDDGGWFSELMVVVFNNEDSIIS